MTDRVSGNPSSANKIIMLYYTQRLFVKYTRIIVCFICVTSYGQTNNLDAIQTQFTTYQQSHLQEKLFVHTDKSFYLAGELLWFKIYNVDESFHKPLNLSKVAYVEILDLENKPVMQAKIALKEGSGNGSFYLPVSVNSGNYKLRAYTNWMKNFSADYYFEKRLTIINSLKTLNLPASGDSAKYSVQFFPEGGNLVNNIQSKVAFKVADRYGKGIDFTGFIINEKSDTVAAFKPLKFGIGHFPFTPEAVHKYKAVIKAEDGKVMLQELPVAYEKGYVMNVSEGGSGQVKITVKTNVVDNISAHVFLFAHTRQVMKAAEETSFNNGTAEFLIDKAKLGDGISQLTVFNSDKQPVCERLYFKWPIQKLGIEAKSDLQQYATRKKVAISLTTKDEGSIAVPADMSVAVYKLDSLQTPDEANIFNYLWLTSDLKGNIESPEYYFNNHSAEVDEALDNLMLTHGWRRFLWDAVMKKDSTTFEFIPEYNGHLITGKVVDAKTGTPAADVETYLSAPGTQLQFYGAKSDANGSVIFNTKELYGQNEVIIQANTQKDNAYRIEIANPFSDKYSAASLPSYNFSEGLQQALVHHSINMQVQNAYAANKLNHFGIPVIDSLPFYGHPSKTYLLDNYTRFTTMEEVLREYVAEVGVRKRGGQYHLPVANDLNKGYIEGDPLILLDGVPVFRSDKIMSYDPLKVRKLDVVTNRYYYGPFTFDGIINFTTYNGTMEGLELDPHAIVLDYEGLQLKREFYSPVYETQQQVASRIPDFRNLLYWSPAIKTDTNGKTQFNFYTSDIAGKYVVVVQGINADGKAGSQSFTFEVK